MQVAGMLLGCLLLGADPTAGHKVVPQEMVSQAMLLPVGSTIAGQPLKLLAALGSSGDRSQQLQVVRAYWRLAQAVADYRYCLDHTKTLAQIRAAARGDPVLRLAEAAATAQLREAELMATRRQFELAELARLPAGSPLPLPDDRPVAVPYNTWIKEIFAGRTPPERARLADKVLPLQRQAIDDRAAAIEAADNALLAVAENYQLGKVDTAAVIACSRELLRQQRAFIEAVYNYNCGIADYTFLVAGPAVTLQDLVSALIGPPQSAGGSAPAGAAPAGSERPERRTSAEEPIAENPKRYGQPTPAPPREQWERERALRADAAKGLKPTGKDEPPLESPRGGSGGSVSGVPQQPRVSIDTLPSPSEASQRTANKAVVADATTPHYPALVAASPAVRAKQLAIALNWDRALPDGAGKPIGLADCLMRDGGTNRRATIEAFWLARQRAAEYQVYAGQLELLNSLEPVVLERHKQPLGPSDMLRLQAAKTAARAMMDETHAALVESQYALALRIGAVGDDVWPLAATVPHSGTLDLRIQAQPRNVAESWPVRRLAAMMPGLGENVQQRAAAVVEADAARVAAAKKYPAGTATIDAVLDGVTGQTEQSVAFLDSLTAYNRAIAEYATTVLPPGVPVSKLMEALVAKP